MGCPAEVFCRKYNYKIYRWLQYCCVSWYIVCSSSYIFWNSRSTETQVVWCGLGNCWGPLRDLHGGSIRLHVLCKPWHQHELRRPDISRLFFQRASRKPIWILDRFLTTKRMKHLTSWCMKTGWERFPYNFQFVSWAPFADKNHHTHFSSGGPRLTHAKHSVYALRCFEDTFLTIIESPRCS